MLFLGGKDYINEKLILEIEKQFPRLIIAGHQHGAFEPTDSLIMENVRVKNADIVFVSLQGNSQEEWMANIFASCKKGLFIGVDESFDILAGEMKRTPDLLNNLNLGWLYRMVAKPSRIKNAGKSQRMIKNILLGKD
ncbi:WecB/TagA/CpsF family glycosyltransferase [Oceanobacillus sp. 143]|nr:WecB/TagA/CpsF family glycosyltransferase [Oceanobacillus sp. 143]